MAVWACLLAGSAGGGWVAGAWGRQAAEAGRRLAEERADLAEADSWVLDGRVHLYLSAYAEALRRFEAARGTLERLQTQWRETGDARSAGQMEVVLSHVRDAERLAASLDPAAQGAAAEARRAMTALAPRVR